MPFDPEYTVLNSRLADSFGRACAAAADADKTKADVRQRIIEFTAQQGVDKALFVGEEFDVTLTTSTSSTVDWKMVAEKLAGKLGLDDKALDKIVRRHTAERSGVRVAAKARVERGVS